MKDEVWLLRCNNLRCLIQFYKLKRSYRSVGSMPKNEEQQIFQFQLTLVAVKMKVKFPCRMAVEQGGHAITKQVAQSEQSRFVFNQELRLREESEKMFTELSVCLVTEKGARYISGSLKLYHNELIRAEGERLVVSLSKCLDSEALCELRVEKVVREGGQRKRTLTTIQERTQKASNGRLNDEAFGATPGDYKSAKKIEAPLGASETKSQAHFPVTANLRFRKDQDELRSKQYNGLPATSVKRFGNPSPKSKRAAVHSKQKYQGLQFFVEDRDRVIQGEVYRDNYLKLKQKYQRETENSKNELSRRMMLENNQNNYKLEIVRLKIRNDELEKTLQEKGIRLRELTSALTSLQGRESQISIMRQDIANKQHAMQILQDTVITLSRENDQLRGANKDIAFKLEEKIMLLENQIDSINSRSQNRQQELERELKMMAETLQFKDAELNRKNQLLEKEKRNVYELERSIQNRLFQYDSMLQTEKANCRLKIQQSKSRLDESNQLLLKITGEKNELAAEMDKLKGILLKNEYQFKLYQQEISNLRTEIDELRPLRDKYNEIFKELRIVTEQKIIIEKNHEKIVLSKDSTLDQITIQYKKEIQFHKRNSKDLDERSKTLSSKLIQSEGQLDLTKTSLEKLKRNNQNLNKQYAELKEKEKGLKKSLKIKEEEADDLKKEVTRVKEKNQAIFDSMKSQMTRVREDLAKTKHQLESQIIKNEELMESNAQISMELARLKMTQQLSEEKYEKLMNSAQQKYSQFQKIIKQHQGVIELLEEKIKSQKGNEKEYFSKLQKCDYEINVVADKNDKISKEFRALEERNKMLETNLKHKQTELADALRKIMQVEAKINESEEKSIQLKENLQLAKNQLEKSKKIIQILQKDYDRAKTDILTYSQKLTDKQRQFQQKSQQSRKDKQVISTLDTKHSSLKKQYEKFKQSVSQAMNSSFAQVLQTFSLDKQDNSKVSTSIDQSNIKYSMRGIVDLSNDLVSAINMAGKDNKVQISKLTDRTKQLQRDLDMLKAQLDRCQELSKRQLQQKSHYIEQLEEDIRNVKNEKGETEVQYQLQIEEQEQHIKEYHSQCQNLQSIKSQQQFSISSLKMEIEHLNQDFQRKVFQLKKERQQYEEKLEYQYHNTEVVEKKAHELEIEIMNLNAAIMLQKESSYKKDLKSQELQDERQRWIKEFQTARKQLKHLQEKYSELQIQYITVNQIKQKYECMLNEEESKLKDVRIFNNNILKEKEEIIKKELQKNLEIANLENTINELHHNLQHEQISKNKYKSQYEEIKEQSKRYSLQIKELQNTIIIEKNKYTEIRDKLREKQQNLSQIKDQAVSFKKKLEQNSQKHKNLIQELQEENDMITRQLETITTQNNQTIRTLQGQISKLTQQLHTSKEEMGELEESIFVQRQNTQSMQQSINKLKLQLEDNKHKLEEMEHSYEQLMEENREKDQNMFELGGKIYELENRMKQMEEEKMREIEELNNNLNVKYDEDYQEIYQKIEFIQKQKDYFKEKCQEKEEVISKKNEELKHKEIEEAELKKVYQEKIKKIEEQKLVIFTDKNKEIAKILQDNKSQFESIRLKQSQLRKVAHELQISRTTIQKLESKVKEMQNDKSSQVKVYQNEIENLRKKQLTFKSYKDLIRTNQWNCEREVRKNIQNFIKKILEIGEKQVRNENVISLIKGLEQGLLGVISTITKE